MTRQIEHARAFAVRKGWLVSDDHVYLDDGIAAPSSSSGPASCAS